jgi:hypothetical protein
VAQLIALGASVTFKNLYDRLPIDEAATDAIRTLIEKADEDEIATLLRELQKLPLAERVETIVHEGEIVGYRVQRRLEKRSEITSKWKLGWHGTIPSAVASIFENGLKKPGAVVGGKRVSERKGQFASEVELDGIPNWSRAVFVSPILTYASHPTYAGTVSSKQGTGVWRILVHAYVRPGKYTTYRSTIKGKYVKQDESDEPEEMRADPGDDENCVNQQPDREIVRVPRATNVVVAAVLIANDNFIQGTKLTAAELSALMQGTDARR